MTSTAAFKDAKRQLSGLVSPFERRALLWLVARVPSRINSDHLTILGLIALIAAGLFYWLAGAHDRLWLHGVNAMLFLNWLGDSLDGNLARFRRKSRPRYGFYVDHIVDAFGTLALFGGMAMSGFISERVAFGLLALYYLLMINSNLSAYTLGRFQVSYGLFGPTELRIVLAIGNLFLLTRTTSTILGQHYLMYDVGGCVAMVGMTVTLVIAVLRNTVELYGQERV
jgi:archaetidylinositol phosphate synthase